jgi:HK97 gp10 family phage protein
MAADFDVEVDLGALAEFLHDNGPALLEDTAEQVKQRQADLAPRDPHSSEHMADHITIEYDGSQADIGPEARFFYAAFIEHGTEKLAPRPFIRPSVDG